MIDIRVQTNFPHSEGNRMKRSIAILMIELTSPMREEHEE
jgi:hypothetical protein